MKGNARKIAFLFAVELVDIEGHSEDKGLCENIGFATTQEPPKAIVLLQNPKSTFGLNGTVDSEELAFVAGDTCARGLS